MTGVQSYARIIAQASIFRTFRSRKLARKGSNDTENFAARSKIPKDRVDSRRFHVRGLAQVDHSCLRESLRLTGTAMTLDI